MARGDLRGTNQSDMRVYNERLVLSLIRSHGALAKAEIARLTGLTAQTITQIMRHLDEGELVQRQPRVRGKIGQPSIPYSLRNDGAYAIGMKIGRRSVELIIIDFFGTVLKSVRQTYSYPRPSAIVEYFNDQLPLLTKGLDNGSANRIAGLGIAMPSELWVWAEEHGVPSGGLDSWRERNIGEESGANCPWPVYQCNDATAACAAELTFGVGARFDNHIYLYVGFFSGGGLVVSGNLVLGRRGNAGAFGSMPIPANGSSQRLQLGQCASIHALEKEIEHCGGDPTGLWSSVQMWEEIGPLLDRWLDETAASLAFAIAASAAVIEPEAAIIDGAFPKSVRQKLVARTAEQYAKLDRRGLTQFIICEGSLGIDARAVGGASLPILANFSPDHDELFHAAPRKP